MNCLWTTLDAWLFSPPHSLESVLKTTDILLHALDSDYASHRVGENEEKDEIRSSSSKYLGTKKAIDDEFDLSLEQQEAETRRSTER